MGHCSKSSTRPRQAGLTSFRSVATIMKTGVPREEQPRARRNDETTKSFRRARGCSSRCTPVFMILAAERKGVSRSCLGRVLDLDQWPISTACNPASIWLELPKSMCHGRILGSGRGRNGPTKTRFQGWRCYEITLAAIKACSSSALIFRGE